MDLSKLKALIAQASDRYKMASPDMQGPELPMSTPEEQEFAGEQIAAVAGSVSPVKKLPLPEMMEGEALKQAQQTALKNRLIAQEQRNLMQIAERTGKSPNPVSMDRVEERFKQIAGSFPEKQPSSPAGQEIVEQIRKNAIDVYAERNPDIADIIRRVGKDQRGRLMLDEMAGSDITFQRLRKVLESQKK